MPIQPIAMQGQNANVMLPDEVRQMQAQADAAQSRNAMMQMDMRDKQALDRAYRESGGDINALASNPNLGFGAGMEVRNLQAKQAANAADAEMAQIDKALKITEIGAQLFSGAQDQASWTAAKQQFAGVVGQEAAGRIPDAYDPAVQKKMMDDSLSFRDKLALQREERMANAQQRGLELQERRLAGIEARANAPSGGGETKMPSKVQEAEYYADTVAERNTPEWKSAVNKYMGGASAGKQASLSATELKMEGEIRGAISKAVDVGDKVSGHLAALDSGKLKPGLGTSLQTEFAARTGKLGDENTAALASLKQDAAEARDAILAMNAGVQTDGDAERAYQRVLTSMNDKDMLKDALTKLKQVQERAVQQKQLEGESIRYNKGLDPVDYAGEYKARTGRGNKELTGADAEAAAWANANPNDPRAAAIKQRLGL